MGSKIMKNLKLSLVTSCYNAEKYLDELSESILQQKYQNWEWILADDFSNDNTKSKIEEISKKDAKIRIVQPEYKKQIWWNPQTFAEGDIVCHIDADDKILPKTLELINYYFNKFPDVVLMHFNANKYRETLPNSSSQLLEHFINNVYISTDNNSFLEGFEKLWPNRTNIFGYLRIFRNLPGLEFPVHEDGEVCSSNDGQWLLFMEEKGKWLTIPRTTYLARDHLGSESHRQWNIRGEAKLVTDALERRKDVILEYPRNVKYFDDIYDLAESTYTSKLNFETESRKLSFINFDYDFIQKEKAKTLFPDHEIYFDELKHCDYYYIKIRLDTTSDDILYFLNNLSHDAAKELVLYSDNTHLHKNNRNETDNIANIVNSVNCPGYLNYWFVQDNRFFSVFLKTEIIPTEEPKIVSVDEPAVSEMLESKKNEQLKILQIHTKNFSDRKNYIVGKLIAAAEAYGHEVTVKNYIDVTQNDIEKFDVIHNHDHTVNKNLDERFIPYISNYYIDDDNVNFPPDNSIYNVTFDNEVYELNKSIQKLDLGVDKNKFFNSYERDGQKRMLCVEKIHEKSKIHLAILVASKLGMPIDLVTYDFDEANEYCREIQETIGHLSQEIEINHYENLDEDDWFELYNKDSFLIYFNDNYSYPDVLNGYSCGMVIFSDIEMGIENYKIEHSVNNIAEKIQLSIENFDDLSKNNTIQSHSLNWNNVFEKINDLYHNFRENKDNVPTHMKDRLVEVYNDEFEIDRERKMVVDDAIFDITIRPNPYVKIEGSTNKRYVIEFIDSSNNFLHYKTDPLSVGCWSTASKSYYIPWRIRITEEGTEKIVHDETLNLENKKVFIWFDSKAMGDNVAWIQPVEEFRKKHNCKVFCSTFFNEYFEAEYPEIKFVEPNIGFDDFDHQYRIGFFDKGDLSPFDRKEVPLQRLAAGILGLYDMPEIPPSITVREEETELERPYVAIATQSTAQAKYWNNPEGWKSVVDFLKGKGYNVVCVDKHQHFGTDKYMNSVPEGVISRHDRTLDQTIATINNAEFFIGLGSGLSWVAWALKKNIVLISGFSNPISEFTTKCERVFSDAGCNSCYNRHPFDPSDWLWCPDHKETVRMFECTKNITPEMVFQAIDNVIEMRNNDE